MLKNGIIGVFSLFLACTAANSKKESFELARENASIEVTGTSPIHGWKMHLNTFSCNADFIMEGSVVAGIDKVTFNCKATDLKSDNSLMNSKAYFALKSSEFPEIKFNMRSPVTISLANNAFSTDMKGDLFIAGESISLIIPLSGTIENRNGTNIIDINGKTDLKMSDFNIDPPTFLIAAIKAGNEVSVSFSMRFLQR